MNSLHNHLTEKYSWYKRWHADSGSSLLNWAFFLLLVTAISNFTLLSIKESSVYDDSDDQFAQVKNAIYNSKKSTIKNTLKVQADLSDVVVVGVATKVETKLEKDENGDKLIITHVKLSVLEWLKGTSDSTVEVEMVGGTLKGTTMKSSNEPDPVKAKEKAVFYLQKKSNGKYRITKDENGAKNGLVRLKDRKKTDQTLNLDEIRTTAQETQ
jgi:hypothetical protein